MTTTPVVRTPVGGQSGNSTGEDWLTRYHDISISASGRKSTPRRQLFAENRNSRNDSPLVLCGSSVGDLSDGENAGLQRWSVESATSELKRTPIDFRERGFNHMLISAGGGGSSYREGVTTMRFTESGNSKSGNGRGASICILPTPELWALPSSSAAAVARSTLPRKKQRQQQASVSKR